MWLDCCHLLLRGANLHQLNASFASRVALIEPSFSILLAVYFFSFHDVCGCAATPKSLCILTLVMSLSKALVDPMVRSSPPSFVAHDVYEVAPLPFLPGG